ncbi:UDP-glucosyltransferase 2-like isoform X1 [Pectinophora gossypiella]|uniref:UDP-glucosyltransferase 2-like isoform X1 n=1 Tax=Pectinophora gossypiella TaxID=13191 RepID=UPI00214EBD95|nr:UDP-glucosyltransferase 2-like isoform X1 [Pectinophora gossypiella]
MLDELGKLDIFQKGVVADVNTVSFYLYKSFIELIKKQIEHPEVKKLIEDKNERFDLVIVEAYFNLPLVFSHVFKAPVIQISSFHGRPENYEAVGALGSHPRYYPNFNRNKFRNLSFWENLVEIFYELKLRYEFWLTEQFENKVIKELFGPDAPTIRDLNENVDMLFINTHSIYEDNRPVPPTVVFLGGLHMQPIKELPKDLKEYLDNSKRGVVYVSMGSNVHPSNMDEVMLENFIKAFGALPYDILWKFDIDNFGPMPRNVKTQKWFPQRDLLVHKNIKAFVTQGGLQSSDEAIDAGVPLVGIPMLGDQFYNVHKYVELGIGVQVDAMTFTAQEVVDAVKKVVEDKSYKTNVLQLRSVFRDQPQQPLERAVWWTEYVIRHSGAKHLRAPAANVSWAEYLLLDLLLVPILCAVSTIVLCSVVVCRLCRNVGRGRKRDKLKKN